MLSANALYKKAIAVVMAFLLACTGFGFAVPAAVADDVDDKQLADAQAAVTDAQSVLDDAEAKMNEINAEIDALQAEIDALQVEIDAVVAQVMIAQQEMLEGRESLGETAEYQYRNSTFSLLFSLIMEAESFKELLRGTDYLNEIMDYHAAEVAAQKERKEHFETISAELGAKRDEQETKMTELEEKRAEAEQVVNDASTKLAGAQAHSDRLAELKAQAEAFKQQANNGGASISPDANTTNRGDVVSGSSPVQPNPDTNVGSSTTGWYTGVASAYGGSSDPYTPNPGTTATGARCDDYSMGVAIPMSWPNYRSYFGRTVEISYNGMTVYAVVNDCGYMGGGKRSLDLQPGVFKAFGYGDCYAWGLRTVSYRFL